MEKAKLTREQAGALMEALVGTSPADVVEAHTDSEYAWEGPTATLNAVSLDTLCRALYVGYEIVEEDQVITVTPEIRKEIQDYFLEREKDDREWMVGWRRGYKDALALLGIKA